MNDRCPKCPECRTRTFSPQGIKTTVHYKYDGKVYPIAVENLPVLKCTTCGEVLHTLETDSAILDAVRAKFKLLSPSEISRNRKSLGLTQAALAKILGFAVESVSRWESGACLQSRSPNKFMKLYFARLDTRVFLDDSPLDVFGIQPARQFHFRSNPLVENYRFPVGKQPSSTRCVA